MDTQYGMAEPRPTRELTEDTVTCHVAGCTTYVTRQRGRFRPAKEVLCVQHGIYLSPSTFQYQCPWRNLLWRNPDDLGLLDRIFAVKRTTERLGRERDEDALTWNVVRPFHREGKLDRLAQVLLAGQEIEVPIGQQPAVSYWRADGEGGRWKPLE